MKILKIKPYFAERIWGGQKLAEMGFEIPKDKLIGEAWIISAHENGMGYISSNDEFNNISLKELFEKHRNLFGNYKGEYPLLVKILTPKDYLSVQVHPNDEYALKHHNSLGKPESWYVIEAPNNSKLVYGHNAKTKDELISMVENNEWDKLLKKVDVENNDFLYVPPGKVHAIYPDVVVYELQRSSDITYRFYDYDRVDAKTGKGRELHIQESIDNTKIPDSDNFHFHNVNKNIFSSDYFSLYKLNAQEENIFNCPEKTSWLQITVLNGEGNINGIAFKKMESAITIDVVETLNVSGNLQLLISWIRN
ncbi:type I phosphomannose isomerase catalytic subunit [Spiroplasma endosymbiont of Labia minor]|uniref:type I phosphomannose isomerase catalytic subunit n=1 Tax=Spiroplasma endosymbiont of Labia minor TaxID=3066305 RepID=UPI0030CC5E2B